MKQQDILVVVVVAIIGGVAGFFLPGALLVTPDATQQKVEVVQPIQEQFGSADTRYFNNQSVDLAPNVEINNEDTNSFFGTQN